jgi:hypothetical protein
MLNSWRIGGADVRQIILVLWISLLAGAVWGQRVVQRSMPAPKIEMGAEGVRVPMFTRAGRSIVEARINGKGPYRFYFDTGASGPVISQVLAQELTLEVIGEAAVKSGGDSAGKKPIPAHLVRIDDLELGAAKLSVVNIVAMDRARLGSKDAPVGVLSPTMFAGHLVTLDYPRKGIRIRAGELGAPDNKTVFGYLNGRPIPSLIVAIGDQTIEAHVDSGSPGGVSLPTAIADKLTLEGKPIDTGKKARSVSGDFPVLEGKLKGKLSFGTFSLTNPTIEFSDVVQRGNLGARILESFALTLDIKNRRFQMVETR